MNEYPSSWYPTAPPPSYYNSLRVPISLCGAMGTVTGDMAAGNMKGLINSLSKGASRETRIITITITDSDIYAVPADLGAPRSSNRFIACGEMNKLGRPGIWPRATNFLPDILDYR